MQTSRQKRLISISIAVTLALLISPAVFALTMSINTNDGNVDTNWNLTSAFVDDPDSDGNTYAEIDKVWITNNSSMSVFYFRFDTLISAAGNEVLIARLDCNQNGSYTDAVDVAVIGDLYIDASYECQGDTYNVTCWGDNHDETNTTTDFEEINNGDGTFTYEFAGDVAGPVDWSACTGTSNVQFVAAYYNQFDTIDDFTTPRAYNAPTAVKLQGIAANSGIAWSVVALTGIAVPILRKRKVF